MPRPKKSGRARLDVVAEPWFIDLITQAAEKTERSVSGYVRYSIMEQLRRDGFTPTPTTDALSDELVKPVGRPKGKGKTGTRKGGGK